MQLVRNAQDVVMVSGNGSTLVRTGELYDFADREIDGRLASGHWSRVPNVHEEKKLRKKIETTEVDG